MSRTLTLDWSREVLELNRALTGANAENRLLRKWLRETGGHRLACTYHLTPEMGCSCGYSALVGEAQ